MKRLLLVVSLLLAFGAFPALGGVTLDRTSSTQAALSWSIPVGTTSISIYVGPEPPAVLNDPLPIQYQVASLSAATTSYTVKNLAPNCDHFLRVDFVGGSGSTNLYVRTTGGPNHSLHQGLDSPVREIKGCAPNVLEVTVAEFNVWSGTQAQLNTAQSVSGLTYQFGHRGAVFQAGAWTVDRLTTGQPIVVSTVYRRTMPTGAPSYWVIGVDAGTTVETDMGNNPTWTYSEENHLVNNIDHRLYIVLGENIGQREILRIRGPDGIDITVPFSDYYTETSSIQVNQVGYSPRATQRYAYVSGWLGDGGGLNLSNFPASAQVIEETTALALRTVVGGASALSLVTRSASDVDAGAAVKEINLAALQASANYYRVRVPGVGVSWRTAVSEQQVFRAFYTLARGLFLNRWGGNLATNYSDWPRPVDHPQVYIPSPEVAIGNYQWLQFQSQSVVNAARTAAQSDPTRKIVFAGGYHDAGDFDLRPMHTRVPQFLMRAWEMTSGAWPDSQLNIPESGNAIPDFLDEALWGVKVWEALQKADGSIYIGAETWRNPLYATADRDDLAYGVWGSHVNLTARAAGLFAQAARLVAPYDAARAASLTTKAQNAYTYATANGAATVFKLYASGELFRRTGTESYRTDWRNNYAAWNKSIVGDWVTQSYDIDASNEAWSDFVAGFLKDPALDSGDTAKLSSVKTTLDNFNNSQTIPRFASGVAHRNPRPPGFALGYGQGTVPTKYLHQLIGRMDLGGLSAATQQEYFNYLSLSADYVLGCNCESFVFVSTLGTRYVRDPLWHDANSLYKAGYPNMAGYPVYGPSPGVPWYAANLATSAFTPAYASTPKGRQWADVRPIPEWAEGTCWETQAPLVQLFSLLVATNQLPPTSWQPQGLPAQSVPIVSITAADAEASEDGTTGKITVSRYGPTQNALTVNYTVAGSAVNGTDYTSIGTSVSIPAGAVAASKTITVTNDGTNEGTETAIVTLAAGSYTIGDGREATVNILDNDTGSPLPTVTVTASDPNADENGGTGTLTVARTGSTSASLGVSMTTSGTATASYSTPGGSEIVVSTLRTFEGEAVGNLNEYDYQFPTGYLSSTIVSGQSPFGSRCARFALASNLPGQSKLYLQMLRFDSYLPPNGDYIKVRYRCESGTWKFAFGGSTVYFGNSDVRMETRTITAAPGQWQTMYFSMNHRSDRNFRRLDGANNIGRNMPFINYPRWIQEAMSLYIYNKTTGANSGEIFIDDVQIVNVGETAGYQSFTSPATTGTLDDFEASIANAFTFTHRTDGAVRTPATLSASADANPGAQSLQAVKTWNEETSFVGAKQSGGAPAGTDAIKLRVKASQPQFSSIVMDVLIYVAPTPGSFSYPSGVSGFTHNFSDAAMTQDHAFYHARRQFTGGAWTDLIIPLRDFVAVHGAGSYAANVTGQTAIDPTKIVCVAFCLPFRYAGASATVNIDSIAWLNVVETPATSFWQPANIANVTLTVEESSGSLYGGTKRQSMTGEPPVGTVSSTSTFVPGDYTALATTATIPAGSATTTITVTPYDDNEVESAETVLTTIQPDAAYTVGSPASATVTISDNDTPPAAQTIVGIVATDATASEPGTDTGTITLTRTGNMKAVVVFYTITGTATNGADYSGIVASATFATNATTQTITITPINDIEIEATESATLTLAANANYTISGPTSATVMIADDDVQPAPSPPTITVTSTDANAAEAALDQGVFRFSRTGQTNVTTTVLYGMSGTATSGSDYNAPSGSIAIPPGITYADLAITPIDDAAIEGTETVSATILADAAYLVGAPSSATLQIADNDVLPVVSVTATDANASETGPDAGTFRVARTGSTAAILAVNFTMTGTATRATDYAQTGLSVTIGIGSATADVTITPVDDASVEGTETAILTLANAGTYSVGSPPTATVTIADNDTPPPPEPNISVQAATPNAAEGGASGVFRLSRTGSTVATLDVSYTLSGTAANGTDYTSLTGAAQFGVGNATVDVTIAPIDDSTSENSETAILTLADGAGYAVVSPNQATITIADNDFVVQDSSIGVMVLASQPAAVEGGSAGEFTFQRIGSTNTALAIQYTISGTAGNGTDYQNLSGSFTMAAGVATTALAVTPIGDGSPEGTETVSVTVTPQSLYVLRNPNRATVSIYDSNLPVVTVTATDATANESGSDTGNFRFSRTGSTAAELVVVYHMLGTATPGLDYVVLSGVAVIPAGSAFLDVTLQGKPDAVTDPNESATVRLSPRFNYAVGSPSTATVTIQ